MKNSSLKFCLDVRYKRGKGKKTVVKRTEKGVPLTFGDAVKLRDKFLQNEDVKSVTLIEGD